VKKFYPVIIVFVCSGFLSCTEKWSDHYYDETVLSDETLWDEIKAREDYSLYVSYLEAYQLDTLLKSSDTQTLFVVNNSAFESFLNGDTSRLKSSVQYHIIPGLFQLRNLELGESRRVKTTDGKFAEFSYADHEYYFDSAKVVFESQLFTDGKYYEIDKFSKPKPNLYEYILANNVAISNYIDSKDSVILNKELSKPIGFNEYGQTVYDSVTEVVNTFEEEYFPLSEEYRNIVATIVLPDQLVYNAALDEMAENLGGAYSDHNDIPEQWENELLIPALLGKGIFGGIKEPAFFSKNKVSNIKGDSIEVDFQIDPASASSCSNGMAYNYMSFTVDKSLYLEKNIEGEALCRETGVNRYAWIDNKASVTSDQSFSPKKQEIIGASNDSVLLVEFSQNYQGYYQLTIHLKNVFPNRYRLVWRTNYRTTGLYSVYVNDEKVLLGLTNKESYDTYGLTSGFYSVLGYKFYPDSRGFCNVDGWVDSIDEYGDVTISFIYLGPGSSTDNGFNADFIQLLPE